MTSARTKLILTLSMILVSGFFATSYFFYTESKAKIRTTIIEQNLPLSRDNIYSEIQRDMARPIFVSSLMANDTFLKDWVISGEQDLEKIKKYLGEIRSRYNFSSAFFVSDLTRNYYHDKGILKQISFSDSHDVWFYQFKARAKPYELDVDTNEAAKNRLTVFINHRLTDYQGRFIGVVGIGLEFSRISVLLDQYKHRYDRDVYMVDGGGLVQVHSDQSRIEAQSIYDVPGLNHLADQILGQLDAPEFYEYDREGRHILLTSRYVSDLGWFLMVEQDETQALASLKQTLMKNIFISVSITLITLVFTTLVINHYQKQLETMAMEDPLTRAYNRNEFERRFKYMTDKNRRGARKLSMILLDIDHLKRINDTHGHIGGDLVIRKVAHIAADTIRSQDLLVRWGGDEFIILILAGIDTARQVAERIRKDVTGHQFDFNSGRADSQPTVSVSCGVAPYAPGQSLDELLQNADRAMYLAKNQGRNTVVPS
jgi:diguanylate cyclase (GGDEF)-like protein